METHQATINKIRKIEKEENAIIPVLLDLQGQKIRIGRLEEPIKSSSWRGSKSFSIVKIMKME